jgi:alanine racemase
MAHFAEADGGRGVDWQLERLAPFLAEWQGPVSLANSAAIVTRPDCHRDWVRPGIMLYGGSPFADVSAAELGLLPVMTLASEIIAVQKLQPGERVGYGGTFVAERPMRIGVVACGYADGYPRHAPGSNERSTPLLVDGQRSRLVGRVSMDMLMCDLTDLPQAGVGSAVTLWGEGVPADEVATAAGTICYELFSALARRVPLRVTE